VAVSRLLLSGGTLFDGTGAPGAPGDLLISGETVEAIGRLNPPDHVERIDCSGMAICPGFIDAHSHSDLQVLETHTEKIRQGVTAEVVGNCGFSPYPAAKHTDELHQFANGIFRGGDSWGWPSARAYLAQAAKSAEFATVASLVGHGSLRIAFAGSRLGPLSSSELDAMEGSLKESLQGGATGFSTGLMYAPGSSAPPEELERLCRVVARNGKIYCSHIRDYSFHLEQAIDEQLHLARRTGCRLQISHLQAVGQANWARQERALEKIERARNDGVDVAFDCYPYVAGSTVLTQFLPQSALDGGMAVMVERLQNPGSRKIIAQQIVASLAQQWSDIVISSVGSEKNRPLVGRNLAEIAKLHQKEPVDAMLNLLIEERGEVNIISFNQSEPNLRQTLCDPLSTVISDGFYVKGRPHPRLCGTFPRLLGTIVRRQNWMPLETAIHKVTGKPAERFKIQNRGFLRPRSFADIVVFDPAIVDSPATFEQPELAPVGIKLVLRNGKRVWPQGGAA
jgi:dihydroorotase/N-acyl-D-amino-acid deacylase